MSSVKSRILRQDVANKRALVESLGCSENISDDQMKENSPEPKVTCLIWDEYCNEGERKMHMCRTPSTSCAYCLDSDTTPLLNKANRSSHLQLFTVAITHSSYPTQFADKP